MGHYGVLGGNFFLSSAPIKYIIDVLGGSKYLLGVPKTSLHICNTIYDQVKVVWKNHEKSHFLAFFIVSTPRADLSHFEAPPEFRARLWFEETDKIHIKY